MIGKKNEQFLATQGQSLEKNTKVEGEEAV